MFRVRTSSLALIAGLTLIQGCKESPLGVDNEFVTGENAQKGQTDANGDVALYVSSGGTDNVLAFDGEDGSFESKFARHGGLIEPEGIVFGPDGNLYVSSRSDEVLRYDGTTGEFIDVFASGNGLVDPAGIDFCGPGNDLFVASGLLDGGGGNQILRFDGVTGAFEGVVDPTNAAGLNDPEAVVCGPDGLLYVSSTPEGAPGEVIRYNLVTNLGSKFILAANSQIEDPTGLVFSPDGQFLFLSSATTSDVRRYNATNGQHIGVFIDPGSGGLHEAEGMAFGPNGNLFVASELGHAVLEYNGTTGAFVREFVKAHSAGLRDPTFIVFGPEPD